jgi:AGZA family xanthine/uracil permease-like MFS transporter
MIPALERYFEFQAHGANWRTEILAGFTTFMTMAYIIFVNPSILKEAGMPVGAVTVATCLSSGFASVLMGVVARYPIALAPGMGINAYFTYSVVKAMGVPWPAALGAVFLSGVAFLVLTLGGVRQLIFSSIPVELHAAVAGGIGLFLALIGFRNSGIIVPDPATTVKLGNLHDPNTLLSLFGLLLIAVLMTRRVRAAMLAGILATTALAVVLGMARWQPQSFTPGDIAATAFQLDLRSVLGPRMLEVVFVFLFVSLFDNIGTLVGVTKVAGLVNDRNEIPRINRILLTDATASIVGSLAGTSTVTSYIESSAGIAAGGRTGVVAVVTGLLFFAALFVAPVVGVIPAAATAPALIIVGTLMIATINEIRWADPGTGIPAFLTMLAIPLTFSIADGLAFGFTSYTALKVFTGQARRVNWLVYALTALFIARFVYLKG